MTRIDEHGRPEPPEHGDETATLLGFLDWQRATFAWKCAGLDSAGLATKVAASSMTLGGMLKHLALVEQSWFSKWLCGNETGERWRGVDWPADPDWDWHSAADDSPDELRAMWQEAVDDSRSLVAEALKANPDLGQTAKRTGKDGWTTSLRWILCHMIEEYARHNGHADLIRESIDGQTGE
ncbi:MAG TPA: DinB family protein [Pseudonocardiaceae bacterium]|nr:DinB family protein [Pseudonocardiaceae bacterium]